KNHLDNHMDVELLDLHELLAVIKKRREECNVIKERERAQEKESESLRAKCEAAMSDFEKNPTVASLEVEKARLEAVEVKGYRPSYKNEHDQPGNDLATATFPWLLEFVADPSASVKVLLSKKPLSLQRHAPSKTQALVSSSQNATPSCIPTSNSMSIPVDDSVVKPYSFQVE
nr:hypothetical protein [Tanacetum cinerariifolium]